jgi:phosphoglucomutase
MDDLTQRVIFGTSGHRGSSLRGSFKCQQREEVLEVPVGSVLQMLVKEPLGIPRVAAVE